MHTLKQTLKNNFEKIQHKTERAERQANNKQKKIKKKIVNYATDRQKISF